MTPLDYEHWAVVILLAFMVIPVDLIRKAVKIIKENKELKEGNACQLV